MSLNTDRLIVLRKIKFQESDLIIHGINHLGMKVAFLAKGAVKSRRRFAGGVLDPFHFIEVALGRPKNNNNSSLTMIHEAKLLKGFEALKTDYDRLQLGFYFLELVYKVTQAGEVHDVALFQLLGHVLTALEGSVDFVILKTHFILKFLLQQGVLQVEPWMKSFLGLQFTQNQELFTHRDFILKNQKLDQLEQMVTEYLASAQITN